MKRLRTLLMRALILGSLLVALSPAIASADPGAPGQDVTQAVLPEDPGFPDLLPEDPGIN